MYADIAFTTEGGVVIGGLLTALASAVAVLFKLVISGKDQQIKDAQSERDSYKEISLEAVDRIEKVAHKEKITVPYVAPVVPEHSSPTTSKQQDSANLQTLRARLVAATLQLGQPPREASPPA